MTVLVDQSGRLFSKKKCSLKDIVVNQEVWGGTVCDLVLKAIWSLLYIVQYVPI